MKGKKNFTFGRMTDANLTVEVPNGISTPMGYRNWPSNPGDNRLFRQLNKAHHGAGNYDSTDTRKDWRGNRSGE